MNIFKSKSFTLRFVLYLSWPGLLAFVCACITDLTWQWCLAAFMITASIIAIFWHARFLPIILIAAMIVPARAADKPKNPVGACAIAIVVIIGGYSYYRVVKACQNLKPRVLPDEPAETNTTKHASETFVAVSQDVPPDYCCADEPKSAGHGDSIELEVIGETLSIRPAQTVTSSDFDTLLLREGLDPNKPGVQFSRNHQAAESSPIAFTETGFTLRGENPRRVRLQCSEDLQYWRDFSDMTVPAGIKLRVTDASARAASRFYRIAK